MSIQTIIDTATFITIDKRKLASQTISRSGRLLSAEVTSARPYRFVIGVHEGGSYSNSRAVLEELDRLDITTEENIDIGATNSGLSYITAYQGDVDGGSLSMVGYDGANLYIDASSATATSGNVLFKKGDFVQPQGNTSTYRYPYQVTSDVNGIGVGQSNVTVPVHRGVIDQTGVSLTSGGVVYGSNVTWNVKMTTKPSYTILPYNRYTLDSELELVEVIE
jgi:hypothetical protein